MFPEGRILDFVIVGVVALMVVGPKDLPRLMRKVGEAMGRMRAMAAEFRASFDEMARQSELDELRKEVEAMRAGQTFDDIHAELRATDADLHSPMMTRLEPAPAPAESAADEPLLPFAEPMTDGGEGALSAVKAAT